MLRRKKWEVLTKNSELDIEDVINSLLEHRGIKTAKERDEFLHGDLSLLTLPYVGIDKKQLHSALDRIEKAIKDGEQIVVYGDYDVDGITGCAILWETLYALGAKVMPYIPHRVDEGYGLSISGIENFMLQTPDVKLIITVDNGIVANEAVDYASQKGIDVIVTDHHTRGVELPHALAVVHTTKLCGAGVAWILCRELKHFISQHTDLKEPADLPIGQSFDVDDSFLDLVCLGTVADLVPLTGANRILVRYGLEALQHTKRVGLLELYAEAGIDKYAIGTYEIGHVIGPRLNAMGRLLSAMDSLRLVCTKDPVRAKVLAEKLGVTNRERQLMTMRMTTHAVEEIRNSKVEMGNLLFVSSESYEQGIVGLIAGRLVEEFYRPAIVFSKGETISKASARSVTGFNMIEFIRQHADILLAHGGHPMAAGLSVETGRLLELQEAMERLAAQQISDDLLIRGLKIDCEIPLNFISQELYQQIQKLAPFGMGNFEPVFVSRNAEVIDIRPIGAGGKHLKLKLGIQQSKSDFIEAVAFGMGELANEISTGDIVDVVYTIDENTWNGKTNLQMKVKDMKKTGDIDSYVT